jgi:hypothetical protein
MRKSASIALMPAALLLTAAALAPRPAAALNYPWCATYYDSSRGMTSCAFTSFGQCLATVSGIGGHCSTNPSYAPSPLYAARHRSKKSHHLAGDH